MEEFLYEEFKRIFNYYPKEYGLYFAPGRINLIGEHTDYTGGTVLPASINCGTYILATKNNSKDIRINSLNFENKITVIKFDAPLIKTSNWSDYFKGCLKELDNVRSNENGFDALIFGNIPNGSGLSSSASFEMASLITILDVNNLPIPKNGSKGMVDLTISAKNCENNFVGVNCGIMDQFAIGNGKKDMCVRLDCYDLSFEYSPLNLGNYRVLVANTNKKRRLEESKYNERRQECEEGFEILKKYEKNKTVLGRVTIEEWNKVKVKFNDNTIIKKRLNHVISENNRVKRACDFLKKNDIVSFSKLINESGESLKNDFEVTGEHLDAIVESARDTEGVLAARMTGAGFGGCAICIVENNKIEEIKKNVETKYLNRTGIKADFYTFDIDDGARKLK